MEIRKALRTDIDSLIQLNSQIGQYHFENSPNVFSEPGNNDKDFLLSNIDNDMKKFLVAQIGNRVIGFITAYISQNTDVPFLVTTPICHVGTIVVDASKQGSGAGKMLMKAIRDWAISQNASEIRLEVMEFNENAQRFYQKLGYETQSRIMAISLD